MVDSRWSIGGPRVISLSMYLFIEEFKLAPHDELWHALPSTYGLLVIPFIVLIRK